MNIDETDRKILSFLLRAATTPKAEIARAIGFAASVISERIKRLEQRKLIQRYEARLDARALGYSSLAYVFITEQKPTRGVNTGELLAAVTGVEEVHKIAGDDCFLVKIRARDTEELGAILDSEINPIETVVGTRTTIVLRTVKEDVVLGGVTLLSASQNLEEVT
jgi:Lrp/AsnC family leucine-responsive transcriptional regulator